MLYLRWYDNTEDFEEDYYGRNYQEPWFSVTNDGGEKQLNFDREDYKELLKSPLTFEFHEDGEFSFNYDGKDDEYIKTVTYCLNDGPKIEATPTDEENVTVNVSSGDVIKVWGRNSTYSYGEDSSDNSYFFFSSDCEFSVKGNIMSLIRPEGFESLFSFSESRVFSHLFYNCEHLIDAGNLVLPAMNLVDYCYYSMFNGCTSLSSAPEIQAITLANNCCQRMFCCCTSLTTAPELPATTLARECYYMMFKDCISLVNAPSILPATTLTTLCYVNMFYNCSSLTEVPKLPATTLVGSCYSGMFANCTSLTTAPELPAAALAKRCYDGMFYGCTSLSSSPELPATTLVPYCYNNMFGGCTKLNYIKAMFTTTPGTPYTKNWVSGVAATGTFVKNSAATWNVTGVNGVPDNWTIENETA